jgi:predicted acetyltransferase
MKKAMELYIKQIKKDKIIGCEPSNIGSRKIIEYLATKFKNIKEEDGIFTFDDGTKITCIR